MAEITQRVDFYLIRPFRKGPNGEEAFLPPKEERARNCNTERAGKPRKGQKKTEKANVALKSSFQAP